MAEYKSNYTGPEIDAAIGKVDSLQNEIKPIKSGSFEKVTAHKGIVVNNHGIYDPEEEGPDNDGTYIHPYSVNICNEEFSKIKANVNNLTDPDNPYIQIEGESFEAGVNKTGIYFSTNNDMYNRLGPDGFSIDGDSDRTILKRKELQINEDEQSMSLTNEELLFQDETSETNIKNGLIQISDKDDEYVGYNRLTNNKIKICTPEGQNIALFNGSLFMTAIDDSLKTFNIFVNSEGNLQVFETDDFDWEE